MCSHSARPAPSTAAAAQSTFCCARSDTSLISLGRLLSECVVDQLVQHRRRKSAAAQAKAQLHDFAVDRPFQAIDADTQGTAFVLQPRPAQALRENVVASDDFGFERRSCACGFPPAPHRTGGMNVELRTALFERGIDDFCDEHAAAAVEIDDLAR